MEIPFGDYVPPSMFAIDADYFVIDQSGTEVPLEEAKIMNLPVRQIAIRPKATTLKNRNYTVVIDGVEADGSMTLNAPYVGMVSSEFAPLYASPVELRPILRGMMSYFTIFELYKTIRDSSQKAHQMKKLTIDPNASQYRVIEDRDTTFSAVQKFVVYESARVLLSSLLVNMLEQENVGKPGESITKGDGVTLGDFAITPGGASSAESGDAINFPVKLIQQTLDKVLSDLKFWKDAMMGRNARGYSTPTSASMRSNNGTASEDRSLE